MENQKLWVCRGFPGCGKSTLAKKMCAEDTNLKEVNRDDLRKAHILYKPGKFNKIIEIDVKRGRDKFIEKFLISGCSVINSDTNIGSHEHWIKLAEKYGAEYELIDFTDVNSSYYVSVKECIRRDLLRENSVGKDVILKFYYQSINYQTENSCVEEVVEKANAIWVDIDGTLAFTNGRGPFEEKYGTDKVNYVLKDILSKLYRDYTVIIVSGREGTSNAKIQTLNWLSNNKIPNNFLFMRKEGDRRPDDIVKKEIYENDIKPYYNLLCCFDDRPTVVRMLRSLNLFVFDMGLGMEF